MGQGLIYGANLMDFVCLSQASSDVNIPWVGEGNSPVQGHNALNKHPA